MPTTSPTLAAPVARFIDEARRPIPEGTRTMYAIAFDMGTKTLEASYPGDSWRNAYTEIGRILREHGFDWQQGSVYFGNESVNAVTCVMAAIDLTRRCNWFGPAVRDMRMLRIEELNDLGPAIEGAGEGPSLFNS